MFKRGEIDYLYLNIEMNLTRGIDVAVIDASRESDLNNRQTNNDQICY